MTLTKTSWEGVGNQNGEVIGTVSTDIAVIDHFEGQISCEEDPDFFAYLVVSPSRNIVCTTWTGGSYTLNGGYHYTITVNVFDVPYYGFPPLASVSATIVGEGPLPQRTVDIKARITNIEETVLGYPMPADGNVEVTFSAPVKDVRAWIPSGFGGVSGDNVKWVTPQQKDAEGKVWIVNLSSFFSEEGSLNLNITANDAETGLPIKGNDSAHAYAFNIPINSDVDAINGISMDKLADGAIFTLSGIRVTPSQMQKGSVYIQNNRKFLAK